MLALECQNVFQESFNTLVHWFPSFAACRPRPYAPRRKRSASRVIEPPRHRED
jgi:hypothetical protein